jgi:hypothetical protein
MRAEKRQATVKNSHDLALGAQGEAEAPKARLN